MCCPRSRPRKQEPRKSKMAEKEESTSREPWVLITFGGNEGVEGSFSLGFVILFK